MRKAAAKERSRLNVALRGVSCTMASLDSRTTTRVLRHRRSRSYFKDGAWTSNLDEANNFPTVRQIAETCVRHHLREVDLVLRSAGFLEITIRLS